MKFADIFHRKKKPTSSGKKKIKGKSGPVDKEIVTTPLAELEGLGVINPLPLITPQQIIFGSAQSVGMQRTHNEDSVVAFSLTMGSEGNPIPIGLFLVADGMGGYQLGEVASGITARTITNYLFRYIQPLISDPKQALQDPIQEIMKSAIQEAQSAVISSAPGSGTTLTAALVLGQQVTIGHIGDSRAYAIHMDNKVEILTRDHTLVKRLEELGQLSPSEAMVHPQRNILYRALGRGDILEPDVFTTHFPQPGYLMLCSDGLWSVVPDDNIAGVINQAPNLTSASQNLVSAANDAGGPDNISVVLAQLIG